jgi:hypothetical protein
MCILFVVRIRSINRGMLIPRFKIGWEANVGIGKDEQLRVRRGEGRYVEGRGMVERSQARGGEIVAYVYTLGIGHHRASRALGGSSRRIVSATERYTSIGTISKCLMSSAAAFSI